MPPLVILIKLMDVANNCGNIFNCVLALKRIQTEFPRLCLGTVRGTPSGTLHQHRHARLESAQQGLTHSCPRPDWGQKQLGKGHLLYEFMSAHGCGRQQARV